jgi:hypothetical protein
MVTPLEEIFPALAAGEYRVTSPVDKRYNCIAYAAGDIANWWWPLPAGIKEIYWPAGTLRAETVAPFRGMFELLGYAECAGPDLEAGIEKIALFANAEGIPLHAARQQTDGRWISKLGEREDIEHALDGLEGDAYGKVVLLMKRPRRQE